MNGFVKICIDFEKSVLFFLQKVEYINTNEMLCKIEEVHGKKMKMKMTQIFNWAARIAPIEAVKKVFGSLAYEKVDAVSKYGLKESIEITEGE